MAQDKKTTKVPKSRVARTARFGSLVGGQGVKWTATNAANRLRSDEQAQRRQAGARDGPRRPAREAARPDEGRRDEDRAGALDGRLRADPRGRARGVQAAPRRAARQRAAGRLQGHAQGRGEGPRRPAERVLRGVRRRAGRRRVDRAGLPRANARRRRRRGEGPVPGRRRGRRDRHAQHAAARPVPQADGAGDGRQGAAQRAARADRRRARLRDRGLESAPGRARLPRPPVRPHPGGRLRSCRRAACS